MNIAILGGSFDPPHNGHILVAKEILRTLPIDEVWLVPAFSHPFHKNMSAVSQRLSMTKRIEEEFIRVMDHETTQKKTSFSIETLDELQKEFPNHTFSWIIGSDQIKDFQKWKEWERILTDYKLIIFERPETSNELKKLITESLPKDLQKNITIVTAPNVATSSISSSQIRNLVKQKQSIANLVPKAVESYITDHNLYQ